MGTQESKQEVFNEQVNVNTGTIKPEEGNVDLTTVEVYGIAVLAVITCFAVVKLLKKYFKKAVQGYTINQV
jgi:hypothetical protein